MAKLFLYFIVLAVGAAGSVSATHAALRAGDTRAMSLNLNVPNPPCQRCGGYRTPGRDDIATLNPQPLPPKAYGNGLLLRR